MMCYKTICRVAIPEILENQIGDEQDAFEATLKVVNEQLSEMLSEEQSEGILQWEYAHFSLVIFASSNYGQGRSIFIAR